MNDDRPRTSGAAVAVTPISGLLGEGECEKIRAVKAWVVSMLEERSLKDGQGYAGMPSHYWSDFCRYFSYMLGLPEESYSQLRLHTYHLDGDNYQDFYFGDAQSFRRAMGYDALVAGLPVKYRLSAPAILGEFGYDFDGSLVNKTLLRFQKTVRTLYREGVLQQLETATERSQLLEIGGGYGCLALHLKRLLPNTTYWMVDLPETLLFAASYLSLALPDARMYFYDAHSPIPPHGRMADYDFILLPNYALRHLQGVTFDLALNTASFQEMSAAQLNEYLDCIRATSKLLYSSNHDVQDKNPERIDVTETLRQRFRLTAVQPLLPLRTRIRALCYHAAYLLRLAEKPQDRGRYEKEYVCIPR